MGMIHTAVSVSTTAVQVVPPRGYRRGLWIQCYGSPEYPNNPSLWIAFNQVAVVAGAGSYQITAGTTIVFGLASAPDEIYADWNCPVEYISVIATNPAVGAIIEMTSGG